jgi:hypothetical protein
MARFPEDKASDDDDDTTDDNVLACRQKEKPIDKPESTPSDDTSDTDADISRSSPGTVVYAGKGGHPYDVYIGRAVKRYGLPESYFANPFKVTEDVSLEEALRKYEDYLHNEVLNTDEGPERLEELRGKALGCWCAGKQGAPEILTADDPLVCHGQILLRALNNGDDDEWVEI